MTIYALDPGPERSALLSVAAPQPEPATNAARLGLPPSYAGKWPPIAPEAA